MKKLWFPLIVLFVGWLLARCGSGIPEGSADVLQPNEEDINKHIESDSGDHTNGGDEKSNGDEGNNEVKEPFEKKLDVKKPNFQDVETGVFQPELTVSADEQELNINFSAKNISGGPLTLYFSSGQQYDFWVYNENNELIYQWSNGKMFTMAIREVTLENGDRVSYKEKWDYIDQEGNKVPEGNYRIEFKVTAKVLNSKNETVFTNELSKTQHFMIGEK